MFFFYQLIVSIILLFSPIIILYRIIKGKEHKRRFLEKFSFATKKRKKGNLIWFHGASVGELMSIIPLIKYYEKKRFIDQILITSSTLSSSKIIDKYKFKKTCHQFYPIDQFIFTKKFLNFWKPNLAIYVDSEIWPGMFKNLNDTKIPLILLNARITRKTFKRWMKVKNFAQSVFDNIKIAYPQNNETKVFLKKLKIKNLNYLGNLKFAENPDDNFNDFKNKINSEIKKKKVWIASSTHKNEEIFCAKVHIKLKKKVKNLLTIIIPRHIHRVEKIVYEINKLNLKTVCHSQNPQNFDDVDVYIVDTFGDTKTFHKIGSSVFLGGSLIKHGGQNPLEAARFGAKIFHGPNIDNFKDVYKLLRSLNISKKITSTKQLASSIFFKKNNSSGNKIKNIGEKILKKTIKEINTQFYNEFKKT